MVVGDGPARMWGKDSRKNTNKKYAGNGPADFLFLERKMIVGEGNIWHSGDRTVLFVPTAIGKASREVCVDCDRDFKKELEILERSFELFYRHGGCAFRDRVYR